MLGVLLLVVSLALYFVPRQRYLSLFLYLSFMMGYGGGFGLWTDSVLGTKNIDNAIIYTLVINVYLMIKGQWHIPKSTFKPYYLLISFFLIISVLFSFIYYGLSLYQIIQGGRRFLLLYSLPILIRIKPAELGKILKLLFYVCLLTAFIYIIQVLVVRHPLMPYASNWNYDITTGLPRLYNGSANVVFFLTLSFFVPQWFPKDININIIRIIYYVSILCTLGRTYIVVSTITILFALMLNGNFKKVVNAIIILSVLITPFIGSLSQRFEKSGTENDMQMILKGEFGRDYSSQGDATMLYRFAWCYERADYLLNRPMIEQLFGMGLCSDSQDWVKQHYHFNIGLYSEEEQNIIQLDTPDIAYGNLITRLGFLGGAIYLLFYISLTRFFWQNRKNNPLFLILCASLMLIYVESFSGSSLSETKNLCLYFLVMSLSFHRKFKASILYRPLSKLSNKQ